MAEDVPRIVTAEALAALAAGCEPMTKDKGKIKDIFNVYGSTYVCTGTVSKGDRYLSAWLQEVREDPGGPLTFKRKKYSFTGVDVRCVLAEEAVDEDEDDEDDEDEDEDDEDDEDEDEDLPPEPPGVVVEDEPEVDSGAPEASTAPMSRRDEVLAWMVENGVGARTAAKHFDMSVDTVKAWVRRYGKPEAAKAEDADDVPFGEGTTVAPTERARLADYCASLADEASRRRAEGDAGWTDVALELTDAVLQLVAELRRTQPTGQLAEAYPSWEVSAQGTRALTVELTEEEQNEAGKKLVSLMSALQRHKLETVSIKAERDASAKEIESEIAVLSRMVDTGQETRTVPVATMVDMGEGLARIVRQDTMEIIHVRPLEQHERQGLLWGAR